MQRAKKILAILISTAFLGYTFYFTEPPTGWQDASVLQILEVFLPILALLTLVADLFLDYLPRSFIIGLGLMLLLAFQAAGKLSFITATILVLLTILLSRTFPKLKVLHRVKIPKLQLSNPANRSKLTRFDRRKKR